MPKVGRGSGAGSRATRTTAGSSPSAKRAVTVRRPVVTHRAAAGYDLASGLGVPRFVALSAALPLPAP